MRTMTNEELRTVNGGGTSYIRKKCKYAKKGCKFETKEGYNNAWWCRGWTKRVANGVANRQVKVHEGRYCIYKYL